jgi:hypothetical protein
MGGVVARGAQQYSYTAGGHGHGVTCGSGTSGGGGREGAFAAARLLQLRCAGGHAVARVLPSGALVVPRDERLDRAAEQELLPGIG